MLVMFLFIRHRPTSQPLQKVLQLKHSSFAVFIKLCFENWWLLIFIKKKSSFFLINYLWHICWSSHSSVFDSFRSFIRVFCCKSYIDNNVIMASVTHVSSSLDLWPRFDSCLWNFAVNLSLKTVFSHDIQAIPSLVTKGSAVHKLDNHPLKLVMHCIWKIFTFKECVKVLRA